MKKIFFHAKRSSFGAMCLGISLALGVLTFTACSDDDEGGDDSGLFEGTLDEAPYESDAVKYIISGNDEFGVIELTASGNYIVLPPDAPETTTMARATIPAHKTQLFKTVKGNEATSRAVNTSLAKFGTFTKNDNGSFTLTDFGDIQETGEGQLEITLVGESPITVNVTKADAAGSDELTKRLNHTWEVVSVHYEVISADGTTLYTETISDVADLKEETVKAVLVTNHNSYFQIEWDNSVDGYGSWTWSDKTNQVFSYEWLDDPTEPGGKVQVRFSDDTADFSEEYSSVDENGATITMRTTVHCRAAN